MNVIHLDEFILDRDNCEVRLSGKRMNLSQKQVELLWTLPTKPDYPFARQECLSAVWA